ncbi:MAG TPA: DUF4347 domain-containing protein, partial [Thermoguttaceae bacterium]
MFKKLLYRSQALASEVGDTLRHLYRWHQTCSTQPGDRVLDMYALEERILFNIAPIMDAAAIQAGAAGAGTAMGQDPQASMLPAADQFDVAIHQTQAGHQTEQVSHVSDNLYNNSIATIAADARDQVRTTNTEGLGDVRQVNFALIDDSLQDIDLLMRSLAPNTEIYLYDHQQQSPTDVLSTVYDWAKTNNAQIDSLSILSHGASGSFVLGNEWLSLSTLGESAEAWQRLGDVMTLGADINIFGCNIAAGTSGQDLIDNIGRLSGADVFASVDDTGYGGDWVLEAASTTASASAWHNPLDAESLRQWTYQLAPGITVTPTSGLNTSEAGGTAMFTVVLNSAPTADVNIGISSNNTNEGTVSTSSLRFTTSNWNVAQTVTITGVDDIIIDGNVAYTIVTAPAASADPIYNGMNAADVSVINTDNETAQVLITQSGGATNVAEGGATDAYTVRLTTQPLADVIVTLNHDSQLEPSSSTLTFTSANWSTPQTVTVTGADDSTAEGVHSSTITHSVASSDASYDGITAASVMVNIIDNDIAAVQITESGGSTNV